MVQRPIFRRRATLAVWWGLGAIAQTVPLLNTVGCRSGAPKAGPIAPTSSADVLKPFVGQDRILRFHGRERSVSLKKKDVALPLGKCDIAVHVTGGVFERGQARLTLEVLGRPHVSGQGGRKEQCRTAASAIVLTVSDFADDPPEEVAARISLVLPAPEAYLQAYGVHFDREPGGEDATVASPEPDANENERRLARQVTTWPKALLSVDPVFWDPARKIHYEGQVEFVAVVSTDGRLRHPLVKTTLDEGHDVFVKRALAVWRFDPARRGDQLVAARVSLRTVFSI
jgi:hypothetical protein